jgi:predicted DNA binding CopG/RHH family protein
MNQETETKRVRKTKAPELKKDKMVHVLLTSKQAEQLKVLADEKGVSVSQYIRLVLKLKG